MRPSAPFVACGHKKGNGLTPVGFSIIALPGSQAFHYGASPLYPIPNPRMACGQFIDVYGGRGGGALPRPAPFHLLLPTILLWGYAPMPRFVVTNNFTMGLAPLCPTTPNKKAQAPARASNVNTNFRPSRGALPPCTPRETLRYRSVFR